jgi:uncharacterized protein YbjT (DUF2867 family)
MALHQITEGHESVILKRGRKTVAVMMPPDVLEALEDLKDVRSADALYIKHLKNPSRAVSLAQVKRDAGLA